jgi:hypothetical protein
LERIESISNRSSDIGEKSSSVIQDHSRGAFRKKVIPEGLAIAMWHASVDQLFCVSVIICDRPYNEPVAISQFLDKSLKAGNEGLLVLFMVGCCNIKQEQHRLAFIVAVSIPINWLGVGGDGR